MKTELDTSGIEKLEKMLKQKFPKIRVGIMGAEAARGEGDKALTNADIGLIAEVGTENSPKRSWLLMPLNMKFSKYLEDAGFFDKKTVEKAVKEGSFKGFMKKIGALAELVIQDAFDTGGFGEWEASDMKNKKNDQTLVETQQLRNSITSEVRND